MRLQFDMDILERMEQELDPAGPEFRALRLHDQLVRLRPFLAAQTARDNERERGAKPLMKRGYWKDTAEDPDRERRRQAEFLVHERVPWDLIAEIGVMDAAIKRRVEELLVEAAHRPAVAIRRSWYYDEKS